MHDARIVVSAIATAVLALALLVMVQIHVPATPVSPVNASFALPVAAPPILTEHAVAPAWPKTYKVRSGDTLSSIAQREYGTTKKWPNIFWQNNTIIKWANVISAGITITIPDPGTASRPAPSQLGPPQPVHLVSAVRGSDGSSAQTYRSSSVSGSYLGSGWHEQCIIRAESGGNSQVTNSSGHYGLYQFSESTWVGSGGSAADFGHASASEQRQVFQNAVAARGYSDWDPYDGC